jgi:hypothetical protein
MDEVTCGRCHGDGCVVCSRCDGTGEVMDSMPIAAIQGITRTCRQCRGDGTVECNRCDGEGYVVRQLWDPGEYAGVSVLPGILKTPTTPSHHRRYRQGDGVGLSFWYSERKCGGFSFESFATRNPEAS